MLQILFIPSRVSGRGYKIGPVCLFVCLFVCLSVCQRSHGWTVSCTDPKFGRGIHLHNISDKFKGQGHRSKVKVTMLKKHDFWCSCSVCKCRFTLSLHMELSGSTPWHHGMTSMTSRRDIHDVTAWHPVWHHVTPWCCDSLISCCNVWNVCVRRSVGQEYWQEYVAGGRVNAQAFSFCINLGLWVTFESWNT